MDKEGKKSKRRMRAQLVFNPWESRALIAKTVINHPLVKKSLKDGIIAIGRGITNAFIVQEILKKTKNEHFELNINNYVAGVINGSLCASDIETRSPEIIFRKGVPEIKPIGEAIDEMGGNDLVIKGGNALDPNFVAGVLVAHPKGGTIGAFYSTAIAKGVKILVPISLEKMVPYPLTAMIHELGGQTNIDYARGLPVGLFPIVGGETFTEIDALELIGVVDAFPIASGGALGGEGSVTLEISGNEKEVTKAINLAKEVYGTQPMNVNMIDCKECEFEDCEKSEI
jgi:hypothetical protein